MICFVVDHRYHRIPYPEAPDSYFLRCGRCGHERDPVERGPGHRAMGLQ
jgi:hypothetical protein